MNIDKPNNTKVICLTPVVNEAFELDRFLQAASIWADHIIAGYQVSTDETLEILERYPKVIIVHSPNTDWNELVMRSLLYEEARKIDADNRVIMNLDADELISSNLMTSPEWKSILELPAGSVVRIPWVNLQPDMQEYTPSNMIEVGFIDDGTSMLSGSVMHMGRVPWPNYDIKILRCNELKLLHYQLTNPERQKSKNRWYQTYEKVGKGEFGPSIFRKYYPRASSQGLKPVDANWYMGYSGKSIDVTSVEYSYDYSHDYRILEYLDEYGAGYFKMCDIWDKDWVQFGTGKKDNPERFKDPRTKIDKFIYRYINWSIHTKKSSLNSLSIRIVDGVLRLFGYSS